MLALPDASSANSRSWRIFSARSLSRRCTRVTCDAILVRYRASSTAVLPPPHHRHRLASIEEAVAGGARRDALAAKGLLGGQAEILCRGAGGDDERIAGVFTVVAEQAEGTLTQFDPVDVVEYDVRVESFRVPPHAVHQRGTLQVFDIAGPIVHIGGGHELSALFQSCDEQGVCGWLWPHRRPRNSRRSRPQNEETTCASGRSCIICLSSVCLCRAHGK